MNFAAILGQGKALTLLNRALSSGRLAHAYLFVGPDGVGKTTCAAALAAVLLCCQPLDGRACMRCPGCLKYLSGNHPDFLRIRPDGAAIKIDQIRELKKALYYAPFEGGQRVVLLEDVHTMRREAGNSLLKTLEEPPPGNMLILVGNSTEAILATIVSRCQVIPFAALALDVATAIIRQHRPDLDVADCQALAALTGGSPGQALALEADGLLPVFRQITQALVAEEMSVALRVEQALALAVELAACKEGMELVLQLLRIYCKDVMAARSGVAISTMGPEVVWARERWSLEQLSAKLAAIDWAEQALARNCNRSLTSEVLLLELLDSTLPLT